MSEQQNIGRVTKMYEAFGRGDIPYIIDQLADDVRWVSHLEPIVPWSGDRSGKANVPKFFQAIAQNVDVRAFEPTEFVAQGDTVVSMGRFRATVRATGKTDDSPWIFIWKFGGGKVVSYEQFHDSALAAAFK
jgi:ketosteroid isomerase-like protein